MKYEPVRRSRSEDQFGELKNHFNPKGDFRLSLTGLPNKVCPRLRDSACWRSGEITQPTGSPKVRVTSNHPLNFGIGGQILKTHWHG